MWVHLLYIQQRENPVAGNVTDLWRGNQKVLHVLNYSTIIFRFKDRIFIPDKSTRSLLKVFCCKSGITETEFLELERLMNIHAPSLLLLLQFLRKQIDVNNLLCPREWLKFIGNLASPSPVCAFIFPNKQLFTLLKELCSNDRTWQRWGCCKKLCQYYLMFWIFTPTVHASTDRCTDSQIKCSESKPATKQDMPAELTSKSVPEKCTKLK